MQCTESGFYSFFLIRFLYTYGQIKNLAINGEPLGSPLIARFSGDYLNSNK